MHLIEKYALSTGSKIAKPQILKKFFPVPCEKYITLQNSSGMPGKSYDYFQEVINFLSYKLNENGFSVVQIGGAEDKPIEGAIHLQGKTTINQTAYIIDNSCLHVGNDSFAVHMASAFNIPLVALYNITSPEIAGPYWKNEKQITLIPPNWKPSFNPNESPKKVNEIKIEDVVNACESILFPESVQKLSTIYLGKRYLDKVIETMPDQVIHPEFFKGSVLNIRFDFAEKEIDLNHAAQNLSLRPCSIVTEKSFSIELLAQYKANLSCVIYDVTSGCDIQFIKKMEQLGIKYVCIFNSSKKKESTVQQVREQLMEYCDVQEINTVPKDIPQNLTDSNLKYRSNRIILANQKIYPSRAAQLLDLSVTDSTTGQDLSKIVQLEEFKEDIEYCYIYSEQS